MYYSNFTKTILLSAEQSIPRRRKKEEKREQSGNPWWNKFCKQKGEIQEMVKE